jgi:hypothetical protein
MDDTQSFRVIPHKSSGKQRRLKNISCVFAFAHLV